MSNHTKPKEHFLKHCLGSFHKELTKFVVIFTSQNDLNIALSVSFFHITLNNVSIS